MLLSVHTYVQPTVLFNNQQACVRSHYQRSEDNTTYVRNSRRRSIFESFSYAPLYRRIILNPSCGVGDIIRSSLWNPIMKRKVFDFYGTTPLLLPQFSFCHLSSTSHNCVAHGCDGIKNPLVTVAILGLPNSGKYPLFNRFCNLFNNKTYRL